MEEMQKKAQDQSGVFEGTPQEERESGKAGATRPLRAIMTREVQVVKPDAGVREAAETMRHLDVGVIPVCDGERLVGMITDRDIALRVVADGQDPATAKVREAMSPGIEYCFEDQDVQEAARLMKDKQLRRLPVLSREKKLVGIVSIGDLAVRGSPDPAGQALRGAAKPSGKGRQR